MSESAASAASRAEAWSSSTQQRTHVSRKEWEGAWIAEQRAATSVITADARKDAGSHSASNSRATHATDLLSDTASAPFIHDEANALRADLSSQAAADESAALTARTRVPAARSAAPAGAPPSVPPLRPPATQVSVSRVDAPSAPNGSAALEHNAKRFALWRDGSAVDLAMRLKDTGDLSAVIGQLREWLRDSGSYLRRLVVNGTEQWEHPTAQSPTAETPAGQPEAATRLNPPRLNRHI